ISTVIGRSEVCHGGVVDMKSLSDLAKEGVYRTAFTNIAFGDIQQAKLIACRKEAPPFLELTAVPFVVAVIDGITEKEDPGELWDVSDDSGNKWIVRTLTSDGIDFVSRKSRGEKHA